MSGFFEPVSKQRLSDDLAQRLKELIRSDGHQPGDRLPTISEMARRFGVGHATLREALKKLETVGMIVIKHGSGVYLNKDPNTLLISNPIFDRGPLKKLLLDLVEARLSIEMTTATLAAKHATDEHLEQMECVLREEAHQYLDGDEGRSPTNMAFHRKVAEASGNTVLYQILEVISGLFQQEQEMILNIYSSQRNDHAEHWEILQALQQKDESLAAERMHAHLERVREILLQWNPDENPVT